MPWSLCFNNLRRTYISPPNRRAIFLHICTSPCVITNQFPSKLDTQLKTAQCAEFTQCSMYGVIWTVQYHTGYCQRMDQSELRMLEDRIKCISFFLSCLVLFRGFAIKFSLLPYPEEEEVCFTLVWNILFVCPWTCTTFSHYLKLGSYFGNDPGKKSVILSEILSCYRVSKHPAKLFRLKRRLWFEVCTSSRAKTFESPNSSFMRLLEIQISWGPFVNAAARERAAVSAHFHLAKCRWIQRSWWLYLDDVWCFLNK